MFKAKHTLTKAIVLALIAMVLQAEIIAPAGLHKLSLTGGHSNQITIKQTTTRSQSYPDITAHNHESIVWDGPSQQVDLRMNFRFDRTLKHFRVENVYQLEEEEQEPEVQTLTSVSKKVNVVTKTVELPTITSSHIKTTSTFEQSPETVTFEPEWNGEQGRKINNVVLTTAQPVEDRKVKAKRQESSQNVQKNLLSWGKEDLKVEPLSEKDEKQKQEKVEDSGSKTDWKSTLFISANPIQKSTQSTKVEEVKILKEELNQEKKEDKKEDKKIDKKEDKEEKKQDLQKVSDKTEELASNKAAQEWMNEDSSKIKWFSIKSSENKEPSESKNKESEGWNSNQLKSKDQKNTLQRSNLFKQIHEHKKSEEKDQKEEGKNQPEQAVAPIQPTNPESISDVVSTKIAPADVTTSPEATPELPVITPTQIPVESTSPLIVPSDPSTDVIPVISPPEAQIPLILPNSQLVVPTTPTESTEPINPTSPATSSELTSPIPSDLIQSDPTSTASLSNTISQNATPASNSDTSIPQFSGTSAESSTSSTLSSESSIAPSTEPLISAPLASVPLTETSIPSTLLPVTSPETSIPSIPQISSLPQQNPSSTQSSPISEPTSSSTTNLGGDSGSQINTELGGDIGSVSPSTPDPSIFSEDWTR